MARVEDKDLVDTIDTYKEHANCTFTCYASRMYWIATELKRHRDADAYAHDIIRRRFIDAEDGKDPDYVFGLNQLAARIAFTNREKSFGDPSLENIHTKLLLAVSEICEAQEHLRDGHQPDAVIWKCSDWNAGKIGSVENGDKPDGFPIEIADAIIRLLHICNALHIDIAAAIALKVKYNRTRPEKHGRQF